MKRNKIIVLMASTLLLVNACRQEDDLNIDLVNFDTYEPGEIDDWISTNLTDPYNIDVVYRYTRAMHDLDRNISPPDESRVIPQMSIVLDGFINLFEKVGGSTFIKTYTPKQFALFGSGNYRPDGVVIAGTADAGRRITLYGLNGLNENNPNSVLGNLGVVHHEFVHILNQMRFIPPSYEEVSRGDYHANWNSNEQNPESLSRSLGFISRYARQNVGEDFAETMSYLVVSGQLKFNEYALQSGERGHERLKQKESIVRDYLQQNFNIDLTELQYEFHDIMKSKYNSTAFDFATAAADYKGIIDLDYRKAWGQQYGVSAIQEELLSGIFDGLGDYQGKAVRIEFTGATTARLDVDFGNNDNTWLASYDLAITRQSDGSYAIALADEQGSGTAYDYAYFSYIIRDVQPFLDYLESTLFDLDWITGDTPMTVQNYLEHGGLRDVNDSSKFIYGSVTFKYD